MNSSIGMLRSPTLSLIEHSVSSTTRGGRLLRDIVRHRGGGAGEIGFRQHFGRTFRMGEHDDAGMTLAQLPDFLRR